MNCLTGSRREKKRRKKSLCEFQMPSWQSNCFNFLSPSPAIFLSHTSLSTFNLPPPLDSHFICALCFARFTLAFCSRSLTRSSFSLHLSKCFFFLSLCILCLSLLRFFTRSQYFAVNVHLATFHLLLLPASSVILSSRSRHELLTPSHTGQVTAECCLCLFAISAFVLRKEY